MRLTLLLNVVALKIVQTTINLSLRIHPSSCSCGVYWFYFYSQQLQVPVVLLVFLSAKSDFGSLRIWSNSAVIHNSTRKYSVMLDVHFVFTNLSNANTSWKYLLLSLGQRYTQGRLLLFGGCKGGTCPYQQKDCQWRQLCCQTTR